MAHKKTYKIKLQHICGSKCAAQNVTTTLLVTGIKGIFRIIHMCVVCCKLRLLFLCIMIISQITNDLTIGGYGNNIAH